MINRCPCCNSRLRESPKCPRCQADLSNLVSSKQSAEFWLINAIRYWVDNKSKQSVDALELSIHLKKTDLALSFRGFLIDQNCHVILQQLTQKKILPAKKQLFNIQALFPYSPLLQQLNNFTDYILLKNNN